MKIFHFFKNFASNKEAIEKMAEKPLTEQSASTMKTLGWQDTIKFCGGAATVAYVAHVAHGYFNEGSTKGSTGNYNNRIGNYGRKKRYLK